MRRVEETWQCCASRLLFTRRYDAEHATSLSTVPRNRHNASHIQVRVVRADGNGSTTTASMRSEAMMMMLNGGRDDHNGTQATIMVIIWLR